MDEFYSLDDDFDFLLDVIEENELEYNEFMNEVLQDVSISILLQ